MKTILKNACLAWIKYIDPFWVPLENSILNLYCKFFPRDFQRRIDHAIDCAIRYFERIDNWEIDTLVVLNHIIDESYDSRLNIAKQRLEHYRLQWKDPFLRIFDHRYDADRDGAECPNVYVPPRKMHELMMRCVDADRLNLDEKFIQELSEMDDNGSYGTTHILLGCILLKKFSNIDPGLLDTTTGSTIPAILGAQRISRISDIYSERVVFLQWLQLHHLIEPAWIARIVFGQMKDDGWYWNRPPFSTSSYQHPTCLALGAMIQYRNYARQKSPFEPHTKAGENPCP